ncbi:MAG: radical SAM protein [Vicinamibacteria bacterium]|nr:radical SAM protein [Vicinamibacteria bacterium]
MTLLLSTYELGRQPFGLASPAAWLRQAGVEVRTADLSRERLGEVPVERARLVAFYLPMHTATRLALPVIERVRALNPGAHLCAYGLYAPLSADLLRSHGIDTILGPEFEADLTTLATNLTQPDPTRPNLPQPAPTRPHPTQPAPTRPNPAQPDPTRLARLAFIAPDRRDLPALNRYAALQMPDGTRRVVGYTEASRGCKHLCRHCPIVPVYGGQFRVVPVDVTLADIAAQVEHGAQHITFGDPDFFNGPTHARRLVESIAARFPGLGYDVTIKVEHLRNHADLLPVLRDTGCLFVISAVEAVDDHILERLDKGHTREDVVEVVAAMRDVGLPLAPTFVAFTPWTTLEGYLDLLQTMVDLDLVEAVASIQLAIRLLLPAGSRLMELPEIRTLAGPLDPTALAHAWRHPDPRVDQLQRDVQRLVGRTLHAPRAAVFDDVRALALAAAGQSAHDTDRPRAARATVPYLTEPWYC